MENANIFFTHYSQVASEYFSQLGSNAVFYFSHPATYYQLMLIVVSVALGLFVRRTLKKSFVKSDQGEGDAMGAFRTILPSFIKLTAPFVAFILLLLAAKVSASLVEQSLTVTIASRIAIIWFLWAAIRAFVDNPFIRSMGTWVLVPAAFLYLFGELGDVIAILESASFDLGKVEVTAFTVLKAIVFFSLIFWFGKFLSQLGNEYIRRKDSLNISTKELLIKFFDIVLYVVLFIISLDLIGIDLTALTVFSGALGVGLGFGLQKIASNFISGIILLSERSVTLGNLVEMDNGVFGYMRKLGARASVIETFDGKEVMVPNEDFITSRVANLTYSSNRGRIEIPVGVAYGTDIKQAQSVILEAANSCERVSKVDDYVPECFLRTFNDSSVDFLLVFWIDNVQDGRWRAQSEVMFAVWDKLHEHDIEIPFPQRDLHIRSSNVGRDCKDKAPDDGPDEENRGSEGSNGNKRSSEDAKAADTGLKTEGRSETTDA